MLDDRVRAVLARLEAEDPRSPGVPVEPTTGRFLFSLVAPQNDCEVLEIGAGRGYSTIWLAAGVRHLGGRVLSLERDQGCIADWGHNLADAGLDDVTLHADTLAAYSQARQGDPTLSSVTVPLDRGLELSVILRGDLPDA